MQIHSDGQGGTISGNLKLEQGPLPARPGKRGRGACRSSRFARRGLDPEDVIETATCIRGSSTSRSPGSDLRVTGLGIDSRWTTNLQIGGFADAPRFTGRADLVRGNYDFAGRIFRLDRGIIRFRGESPPNPLLDIHAEAQVQGLNASVHRAAAPASSRRSPSPARPPLPQDELLSRILFGTSITNLSAPEALQLASAVAALQSGSGSLDPINALRRAVGLDRLRIVPADVATGQKTAIAAGKYITPQIVRRSDHRRAGLFRDAGRISDDALALDAVDISTIGRTSANVRVSKDY